ncbi:TIGR03620 family F420-dependent LLM class oxidoreductase [Amycolatopsis sp.]|jgi:probable F420-dependent oxidoreductase|uniref:TIGR03620 family F420-dependent LLM class oxidoreductase n=1 Tax=Amycolatopsis sp. TaxID=37632 RepID=UPI002DF9CA14|nr:TIGR03620 family F420-dependent LLM class oxidoreductase [Amycolatopsis sp.]
MDIGKVGVWAPQFRDRDSGKIADVAASVEADGYKTAWVPGGSGGDLFGDVDVVLGATERMVVATGVLNVWMHEAADTARWYTKAASRHPDRLLLGLGASHGVLVEATGRTYAKPLTVLREYLDALDAAPTPVPGDRRMVAALGPRMLELAGARSLGAHPYLTGPEHTRIAREVLGPDALLAPELMVVFSADPGEAREIARSGLALYMQLPNYTRNLVRTGFSEADISEVSDRLVDGLVAWGDVEQISAKAREHWDAGADHVCIQVLTARREDVPWEAWSELAPALREAAGV